MNKSEAIALAQRKANDWNKEYRVLRLLDCGAEMIYSVECSGSYDSPKGYRLVDVFRPQKPYRYLCERCGGTGEQPAGCWDGKSYSAPAGKCDDCNGDGRLGAPPQERSET